jgi:M6 family metalloprotease-like protein
MPRYLLLCLVALAAAVSSVTPRPAAAQDVEMLGARYGTPVPEGYRRLRARQPDAFEFRRAWKARGERAFDAARRLGGGEAGARTGTTRGAPALADGGAGSGPSLILGPRPGPVEGDFFVPVLLGLYANSGALPPVPRDSIQSAYFGASGGTITAFYDEMSGGRAALLGDVLPWVRASRRDTTYTAGASGLVAGPLGGSGAGNFIWELLERTTGVDWGLYDNDGPDGIPNSGDDDGYVDVLAVIQPTRGGECGGTGSEDRIWSHRWALSSAVSPPGQAYVTATPAASGGSIRIDDYIIQAALSCSGGTLAEIGVFSHELGHAFGLPDLYDTYDADGQHSGVGSWDLMGSGSYGCDNRAPEMPCHMGAWTKAMLGWVDVVELAPDTDHGTLTLPPVETSGTVWRVDARDGSGEYFLLENLQRIGFDEKLYAPGLLVWQVDQDVVDLRWPANRVNGSAHMGVRIRQADGRDDLDLGRGRGDGGDPFPGVSANSAFHTVSLPSSRSYDGGVSGLTVHEISAAGTDLTFRLTTRLTTLTVGATGAAAPDGLLTVDGAAVPAPPTTLVSAPFVTHTLVAGAGEPLAPGTRRPFLRWQDDAAAPRARTVVTPFTDSEYIAEYGGVQYELALDVTGGVAGVGPATFTSDPPSDDLWFGEAATVSLLAVPRTGFDFVAWSGALSGQANPASFVMDAPLVAGADFTLTYMVSEDTVELPAATDLDVRLQVVNGTAPVRWTLVSGTLPLGVTFSASGLIAGASVDVGRFPLTVQAIDALGLPATGQVTLDFVLPAIPLERAATPFLLVGEPLTGAEMDFLDRQGNRGNSYDVGDFRAWALASPAAPLSFSATERVHRGTITLGRSPETATAPAAAARLGGGDRP